jgi:hypothetical protein
VLWAIVNSPESQLSAAERKEMNEKLEALLQSTSDMAARRQGAFYVGPDLKLMAVSVTADSSFAVSKPMALFQLRMIPLPPTQPRRQSAVTAKGDRFLVNTVVAPPVRSPVTVVLNWDAVMKK